MATGVTNRLFRLEMLKHKLDIYDKLLLDKPAAESGPRGYYLKVDKVKCLYFYRSASAALLFSALDPLIYRHDMWVAV